MGKTNRIESSAKMEYVPLGKMAVSTCAQRVMRPHFADSLVTKFDLKYVASITVNERGKYFYIIDGQHRVEALKKILGDGWELQQIECRVFRGMSEQEEAEMFDRLNTHLSVAAFDKFKVRVRAGYQEETTVLRIVEGEGLCISHDKIPGAIGAVGALLRVYNRSDAETFSKTLRIIRDAFGDSGFESQVIDGLGHLCQRYNGTMKEKDAVAALNMTRGGVKGLLGKADVLHRQTGNTRPHCVAAAAVEVINSKLGRKKLPSWWKSQKESE